jgi:hypothetical protein
MSSGLQKNLKEKLMEDENHSFHMVSLSLQPQTFLGEVQIPESSCLYGFQMITTENIRKRMYILPIIDCYIEEREERSRLPNV